MLYSVWRDGGYDYYETPSSTADQETPNPRHLRERVTTEIGLAVEEAAWPLPPQAQPAGRGEDARGMIARVSSGLGLGGDQEYTLSHPLVLAGLAGIGYLLWRVHR